MFCLMDASASMTEPLKDLAKRFFMLLHVFLHAPLPRGRHRLHPPHQHGRRGRRGDVLPRHARPAAPSSPRARGDAAVVRERYSPANWNIYAAQASDGDNFTTTCGAASSCLDERDPAGLPVFRLYRDRRTASAATTRESDRLARLRARSRRCTGTSPCGGWPRRRDIFSGVPRAVSPRSGATASLR